MIDFLINNVAIAHNSSFDMKEDMRWISPREFKYGWAGQMIYHNTFKINHLEVELNLSGWITAPILSSLTPGEVVTIAPTIPISTIEDFEPGPQTQLREITYYDPGLTTGSTITMQVRDNIAALPSEHALYYGGVNMPDVQYTYKLTYIKFLAVVVSNTMSNNRNGSNQNILFRSVNPITSIKVNQPI